MDIEKLPFKIGMHYDNWKDDLKVEEIDENYSVFRYTKGDIKKFDGLEITDIFLYFNLDVLFQVEMYLEQNNKLLFEEFRRVENTISIRGIIEKNTKLIELTYGKERIWRDL
ncbi:MAG: hypothetical protein ACJA1Z_003520 [Patiriisocius sp.]|jgi:hypothetical protein